MNVIFPKSCIPPHILEKSSNIALDKYISSDVYYFETVWCLDNNVVDVAGDVGWSHHFILFVCHLWILDGIINHQSWLFGPSQKQEGGRGRRAAPQRCCWCCGVVVSSLTAAVVRVGAAQQPWPPSSQSSRPSASGADTSLTLSIYALLIWRFMYQ